MSKEEATVKTIVGNLAREIDFIAFRQKVADVVDVLCEQYLSVDLLKIDGEFTNRLPKDFDLSVIETIEIAFQLRLDEYDEKDFVVVEGQRIVQELEKYVPNGAVADRQTFLDALKLELENSAKEYAAAPLFANKEDLLLDHENAKQITFGEYFTGNKDDIFTFRNTLEEYARAKCENLMFKKLSRLYMALAETL